MSAALLASPDGLAALALLGGGALILRAARGRAGLPPAAACLVASAWALAAALAPDTRMSGLAGALEALRALSWIVLLALLCGRLGAARARPFAMRFVAVGGLLGLLSLLTSAPMPGLPTPLLAADPFLRLGLALTTVLLAENLWRNADEATRWHVKLPCIVLGGLACFDLVLYADAALSGAFSATLLNARAPLTAAVMPLLAVAAARDRRWRPRPTVSREVVLHGATFVAAGGYLLLIGALGEGLRHLDPAWGQAAEAGLIAAALMGLALGLSSESLRSRLRRLAVDHFFAARYDYRREWLRCVAALSTPEGDVPARAVRAIADAVDSPAGVLLLRQEARAAGPVHLEWAGSWNRLSRPLVLPPEDPLLEALGPGEHVLLFGSEPAGPAGAPTVRQGPELLSAYGQLWLAVPLLHHRQGLFGVILLAPPRAQFPLDQEVYDLLGMLGREVAMFLAELWAAERLAEGQRLADYAKRFAFVAHDLKSASSQLGLVLSNAEDNLQDPEFQADMLLTVRSSVRRINGLIARLRSGEEDGGAAPAAAPDLPRDATVACRTVVMRQGVAPGVPGPAGAMVADPLARLRALAASRAHPLRVLDEAGDVPPLAMAPEAFDSVVTHLVDNAVEASTPGAPVVLRLWRRGDAVLLDIADKGPGLSADFVRDELFRPLSTTKPDGSGIGAWQARELLRTAGGDITVLSFPGAGTTMRLTLPQASLTPAPRPGPARSPTEAIVT